MRAWSFDEAERIDAAFFERRLAAAIALRARLPIASDGVRLVHGEADGLPGLIVDRYADVLMRAVPVGRHRALERDAIADALLRLTGCTRLYERSRLRRAQARRAGSRAPAGCAATGATEVDDPRARLDACARCGRAATRPASTSTSATTARVRRSGCASFGCQRVLNCYCYTGGFSVAALAGGAAQCSSVDSSAPALEQAARHTSARNGFDASRRRVRRCRRQPDAARRAWRPARASTPSCSTRRSSRPRAAHAERAARAYKDINRLALKLLAPGGLLFTFSCSGGVGAELFHKIVAGAGIDAGVDAADRCERLEAAPDHPTTIEFPEGEYLKGLVLLKR